MNDGFDTLLQAHERELQEHERRIKALEDDRTDTSVNVGIIMTKVDTLSEKIDKLGNKVDAIEQKPSKRWDAVITAAISGLVGLFFGLLVRGGV